MFAETGNSIKLVCWCASLLKQGMSICSIPTAQPASFSVCPLGFRSLCQRTNFHRHLQISRHQGSCSADQHKPDTTFDPERGVGCTTANSSSACSSLDINLICHTSKLTCNCRRNMRWNPVANECQVGS